MLWYQVVLNIRGIGHRRDASSMVKWSCCYPWKDITKYFLDFKEYQAGGGRWGNDLILRECLWVD